MSAQAACLCFILLAICALASQNQTSWSDYCRELGSDAADCDAAFNYWQDLQKYFYEICCIEVKQMNIQSGCEKCTQSGIDMAKQQIGGDTTLVGIVLGSACPKLHTGKCVPVPKEPVIKEPSVWSIMKSWFGM